MNFFRFIFEKSVCSRRRGFTLIESLVGAAVFVVISLSVFQTFAKVFEVARLSHSKIVATALANEQFEIARNLPYSDVGVISSIPAGKIPQNQTLVRDGITFNVKTTIRNIDDPFDGTIAGIPNDLSPADYKLVEIEISCPACVNFQPITLNASVGPKNLEGASTNGALFVRVSDANGQPISGADVHIENNQVIPSIVINDTTNADGLFQLIDVPPGVNAYEITVSKTGYSQEKTYAPGSIPNPNPIKPNSTVAAQQVTQISFAIDKTSTLGISSATVSCAQIPDIDFSLSGSKLIGTDPDILKYGITTATDPSGFKTIYNLEWDTYALSVANSTYDLVGSIPLLPIALNPDTIQDLKLVVAVKDPKTLLVTVRDSATQLPLPDVAVRLNMAGYDVTRATGNGYITQTDWSGGSGQTDFVDHTQYLSSDGNIETANPAGELRLKYIFSEYAPSGTLTSSTLDTGSSSNFHQIIWQPTDQPVQSGADSVKFQIATNNDNTTWNYLGPDGTAGTFYTLSNGTINSVNNGNRYLRYKIFLSTADTAFTPNIADISITFTSSCVPPGQVYFSGLTSGTYTLTATKSGYQVYSDTAVDISPAWQQKDVVLTP